MSMKLDYTALIASKSKVIRDNKQLHVHQWWEQALMFCPLSALLPATVASSLMSSTKFPAAASFVNPLNFLPYNFQKNSIRYQDIVVSSASFLLLLLQFLIDTGRVEEYPPEILEGRRITKQAVPDQLCQKYRLGVCSLEIFLPKRSQ